MKISETLIVQLTEDGADSCLVLSDETNGAEIIVSWATVELLAAALEYFAPEQTKRGIQTVRDGRG